MAVFPVQPDGHVGESIAFGRHVGSGVNRERQEGPHAHWIETSPDNRFAIAVDLGLDELLIYRFDARNGALTPNNPPYAKLDPGAGPRHLAFHPNGKFALVNDYSPPSLHLATMPAKLRKLKTVSPFENFSANNDTAEVRLSVGNFYSPPIADTTRAVFSIDNKTGGLTLVDQFPTQGKTPRNFEIDPTGKFLFVANQNTNNIAVFQIDPNSGRLTATKQAVHVPSPVCLKFMAVE